MESTEELINGVTRKIKGTENYTINVFGMVFSKRRKRYLKGFTRGKGYKCVKIEGKTRSIHRLVAEAFVPNPFNREEVNHINGDKNDNNCINLEWVSHQQNMIHAASNNLMSKGVHRPSAKLNELKVRIIRRASQMGLTHKYLSEIFNVDKSVVTRAIQRNTWKHV
jgi:hypothetical protein